jgi:putative PIN family toxin of toxin-antitoxin system
MGETTTVLDTNIYISGFLWRGPPNVVLRLAFDDVITVLISAQQLDEIARVLAYKKLHIPKRMQEEMLSIITGIALAVRITGSLHVIKEDSSDDIILETAVVGGARYIVSGDRHLLDLVCFEGIPILTAREFMRLF